MIEKEVVDDNIAWYPNQPKNEATFEVIHKECQVISGTIPLLTCAADSKKIWRNWDTEEADSKQTKKDERLLYLTSNKWQSISKAVNMASRRNHIHGVEVMKLGKDHILCGEFGLFATKKFTKFDIIGEYTGSSIKLFRVAHIYFVCNNDT
jgi:hypothetical protein